MNIVQVNLQIPLEWREQMKSKARKISAEKDVEYSYIDLIKDTLLTSLKLTSSEG